VRARGVPTVEVKRNDTVRWVFAGRSPHDVTVEDGSVKFRSTARTSGSFSRKMTRTGDYLLVCSIHGKRDMSMLLKVSR
jgi:plastocyanin